MDEDVLRAGSVAPDFTLPDQNGVNHGLSDSRGHWVLLFFYAKDVIASCTKEICILRDHFDEFKKYGIVVWGISADSVSNHKKFSEEYRLPFALLSDPHKKVADRYHVALRDLAFNNGDTPQMSFLINLAGEVEKIYTHINPNKHANQVLADFAEMQKEDERPITL